jgi:repressor LexA
MARVVSMNYQKLGVILTQAREAKQYTQKDIANELSITPQTVSNWERGTSRIEMATLELLCNEYQISFLDTVAMAADKVDGQNEPSATPYASTGFGVLGEGRDPEYTHKYNSLDGEARARLRNALDYEYEKVMEKRDRERVTLIAPTIPACAGDGNPLDDNIEYETIEVLKNKYTEGATHVINLSGDSMEPEFHDGDRLIIKEARGESAINGRVGIFVVGNRAFLRQQLDGTLHPYNSVYPDILPTEDDNVRYVGYVVGILDDSWVVE